MPPKTEPTLRIVLLGIPLQVAGSLEQILSEWGATLYIPPQFPIFRKRRLYGQTKPGTLLKRHIPMKTDSWSVTQSVFAEIDLVSHSGNSGEGEFAYPHERFETSYRIINMVVILQIITIVLSHGDVYLLGEAYAFGVIWSFVMNGLAILVLRFKDPSKREYRVPWNPRIAGVEIPVGIGIITVALLAVALVKLLTKQVATISGVVFTLVLFTAFTISEKVTRSRKSATAGLDQFRLVPGEELTPKAVGVRKENMLVMVRDQHTLYPLAAAIRRVSTSRQDVVVLHIRILVRSASGSSELAAEQLFSEREQTLFTRALALAEHEGKSVHLAVAAATDIWEGILRSAQSMQSSVIVLGASPNMPVAEEARYAGLAWEKLPEPKPQLILEIHTPDGLEEVFYLGPHAPHLTAKEIDLLHSLWLEFSTEVSPEEVHHHDIVHLALNELSGGLADGKRAEIAGRLKDHLAEIKSRRITKY